MGTSLRYRRMIKLGALISTDWSHYVDFIWIDFTTVSSYKDL